MSETNEGRSISQAELVSCASAVLKRHKNWDDLKMKTLRRQMEKDLKLEKGYLKRFKMTIRQIVENYIDQVRYLFFITQYVSEKQQFVDTQKEEEKEEKKAKKTKKTPKKRTAGEEEKKAPWGPTYFLNKTLSKVCEGSVAGVTEFTRPQIVSEIWKYIRKHDLQNPENRKEIICDETFKSVMSGEDSVTMFTMNKHLSQHLTKTGNVIPRPKSTGDKKKRRKIKTSGKSSNNFPTQTLSSELAAICGGEARLKRSEVVKKVWEYVKSNNLQKDTSNKRLIFLDSKMKKIFGDMEKIDMFAMQKLLSPHLT
jgi:upstream activation factor subunit UAF30